MDRWCTIPSSRRRLADAKLSPVQPGPAQSNLYMVDIEAAGALSLDETNGTNKPTRPGACFDFVYDCCQLQRLQRLYPTRLRIGTSTLQNANTSLGRPSNNSQRKRYSKGERQSCAAFPGVGLLKLFICRKRSNYPQVCISLWQENIYSWG